MWIELLHEFAHQTDVNFNMFTCEVFISLSFAFIELIAVFLLKYFAQKRLLPLAFQFTSFFLLNADSLNTWMSFGASVDDYERIILCW